MSEIRNELYRLIDSLPDDDVAQVLADARKRANFRAAPSGMSFAWVGSFNGPADLSTNSEHHEGLGQ